MIEVDVPGKGVVEFPDGMGQRDIEHAIFQSFPDLANTPQLKQKADLLRQRSEAMGQPFGVPMAETQQALAEGLTEGLTEPFVKIPRPPKLAETTSLPPTVAKSIDVAFEKLIGAAESIETPLTGVLAATGAIAPRVAAAAVGLLGGGTVATGVQEIAEAKDIPEAVGGAIDTGFGALMLGGAKKMATPTEALKAAVEQIKPVAPVSAEAVKSSIETLTPKVEEIAPETIKAEVAPATAEPVVIKPEETKPTSASAEPTADLQAEARADLAAELGPEMAAPHEVNLTAEPISIGPGAASPGDVPKESQITQLTEAIKGSEPVKQPISERIANEYSATKTQVANKLEAAGETLRNLSSRAAQTLKGEHTWTDFKDALGKFSGESNRNDYELQGFTHEIRKAVPDRMRREAIVNYLQADGDLAVLAEQESKSKPSYKRGYSVAQKLTADEQKVAANVRSYLDAKLEEGIEVGLLKSGVENYVSQIWDRPNPITQKLVGEIYTGKLAPDPRFIRKRLFQSYFEGEQAGYKPKIKDIGALISIYDQSFSKAVAARRLIKALHEGKAKDGRPLVEVSGVNVPVVGESGSTEALLIKPKIKPSEAGDYMPIDHPALRGWKWAGTDEKTGATVLYQGDLLVHPEVHKHLKNVLSTSALRQNVFSRTLLDTAALLKQTKLSLSGFHFTQEGVHAASHRINPLAPRKIDFTIPDQTALVDHGLQVADYRAYQAFAEGLSGVGGLYERIPVVGKWLSRYNEYLFQEYIPRLKMTMATDALERNRARYKGKLTEDQILEKTANQSNAAFGQLNYAMLGRNPTYQDIFRLMMLAPDFLEARARFAAQALTATGREQQVALLLQGATLYVGTRLINQALTGDPQWDFKHAFSVLYNGREYGVRSVVEDAIRFATDHTTFINNRLSAFARGIEEYRTGRDWRGVKRTNLEQLQDLAAWLVPISFSKRVGQSTGDQLLQASGVTVKRSTATQRLYEKLKDFKQDENLMSKEEKADLGIASDYAPLRQALESQDDESAKKEYDALLQPTDGTKPKTPQQIRAHFTGSVSRPFSGSKKIDQKFQQSLDEKGKALYREAQQERRETAARFTQLQRQWNAKQ